MTWGLRGVRALGVERLALSGLVMNTYCLGSRVDLGTHRFGNPGQQ